MCIKNRHIIDTYVALFTVVCICACQRGMCCLNGPSSSDPAAAIGTPSAQISALI